MEIDDKLKGNLYYLVIVSILFIISLQLMGLSLETHVSQVFIQFYQPLSLICIAGGFLVFFLFLKTNEFKIIENKYVALAVHGSWIVFILFLTTKAGQILPVARASQVEFQLSAATEVVTSSVIVPFLEDFSYNFLFPLLIVIVGVVLLKLGKIDVEKKHIIVLIFLACFVTSTGYNLWVVPGFTSTHIPAYGDNPQAYVGATLFSYGQSVINLMTGYFNPAAHGIHNYIILASKSSSFAIGGFQII